MYILLSGKPPFNGYNDEEIIVKVSKENANFQISEFSKCSTDVIELMKRMIERNSQKRFSAE